MYSIIIAVAAALLTGFVTGRDLGTAWGIVCGVAAFVGKSLRMPVVCVCTAMSASATSCISRSTG